MPIEVLNHMWVGVFSAAFVQRMKAPTMPQVMVDVATQEACATADLALESYRRVCEEDAKFRLAHARMRGNAYNK